MLCHYFRHKFIQVIVPAIISHSNVPDQTDLPTTSTASSTAPPTTHPTGAATTATDAPPPALTTHSGILISICPEILI